MSHKLLMITTLTSIFLLGCEEVRPVTPTPAGESEKKPAIEEIIEDSLSNDESTRENEARSRAALDAGWKTAENLKDKEIIAGFEYTDDLFTPKENGEWDVYNENLITYGFWREKTNEPPFFTHKPIFKYLLKDNIQHVSGPLIDGKNKKIYLQLRASDQEGSLSLEESQKLNIFWTYDFDKNTNSIQRNSNNIVLTAVDNNGTVHGTGGRGDVCWSYRYDSTYTNGDFSTGNESMREEISTGCNQETDYSLAVKGNKVIEIKNNGFETVGDLSIPVNQEKTFHEINLSQGKSQKVPYFNARTLPENESRYAPGATASASLKNFAFIYFDSLFLASPSQNKIVTLQDQKILDFQVIIEQSPPQDSKVCWKDDNFFYFNPTSSQTLKASLSNENFEILSGNQIPESCGSSKDNYYNYRQNHQFPTNANVTGLD